MDLIDSLIKDGWLKTSAIINAFRKIKREDFLPASLVGGPEDPEGKLHASYGASMKDLAEINEALPIGEGQTISQPLVVAFIIEQLNPKPGNKIMDIGSGSGWTSAILAEVVGKKGKVIAVEIVPELVEFGRNNVSKYNFIKKGVAEFILADGNKGYEKEAPFDGILCSAAIERKENEILDNIPKSWKKQLRIGGRIVAPVANSIWAFEKKSETGFLQKEYPGFAFVPLISKK